MNNKILILLVIFLIPFIVSGVTEKSYVDVDMNWYDIKKVSEIADIKIVRAGNGTDLKAVLEANSDNIEIYIPKGTYEITSSITNIPSYSIIRGAGKNATFINCNGCGAVFNPSGTGYTRMSDFTVNTSSSDIAFNLTSWYQNTIENVMITNSDYGIYLDATGVNGRVNTFRNMRVADTNTGFYFTGTVDGGQANDEKVLECDVRDFANYGVYIDVGQKCVIQNSLIQSNQNPQPKSGIFVNDDRQMISGNWFEGNMTSFINITSSGDGVHIIGNLLSSNSPPTAANRIVDNGTGTVYFDRTVGVKIGENINATKKLYVYDDILVYGAYLSAYDSSGDDSIRIREQGTFGEIVDFANKIYLHPKDGVIIIEDKDKYYVAGANDYNSTLQLLSRNSGGINFNFDIIADGTGKKTRFLYQDNEFLTAGENGNITIPDNLSLIGDFICTDCINSEDVNDIDKEDIEGDLNTFIDVAGDNATADSTFNWTNSNMTNINYLSATELYQNGNKVADVNGFTMTGMLSFDNYVFDITNSTQIMYLNASYAGVGYSWDGLDSPSDINCADITDDNTYVKTDGTNIMTGDLNINNNDISNWIDASGLQEELIGFWGFEQNGQASNNQTAYDSSREGNDGTLGNSSYDDNAQPTWVTGKSGTALDFDGGDYVETSVQLLENKSELTVSVWANSNIAGSNKFIISEWTTLIFRIHADDYWWRVWNSTGTTFDITVADDMALTQLNEWHHHVLILNGTDAVYYRDGDYVTSTAFTDTLQDTAYDLRFGRDPWSYYFNGTIDNIKIYDRDLSAKEIRALYLGLGAGATGHLSLK